jgi:hypothetical protein
VADERLEKLRRSVAWWKGVDESVEAPAAAACIGIVVIYRHWWPASAQSAARTSRLLSISFFYSHLCSFTRTHSHFFHSLPSQLCFLFFISTSSPTRARSLFFFPTSSHPRTNFSRPPDFRGPCRIPPSTLRPPDLPRILSTHLSILTFLYYSDKAPLRPRKIRQTLPRPARAHFGRQNFLSCAGLFSSTLIALFSSACSLLFFSST